VLRELKELRHRDSYEMIAMSLPYLQTKFDLADTNTCGSVMVFVDGCFCYGATKMEMGPLEQRYVIKFCVMLGEVATDVYEKIQKAFGNDSL
jgi:hypothetical protein